MLLVLTNNGEMNMKKTTNKMLGQKAVNTAIKSTQTTEEIKKIIVDAETNHGFISIRGYENQKGAVTNYLVQPLGEHGYHRILNECLEKVDDVPNKGFDDDVFEKAKAELKASWTKSLNGGHGIKNNYSKENKGFYSHSENESVYIRNVVIVSKKVLIEGVYPKVNSAQKTIAKRYIKKQLPIGKFQNTFKLTSGKFETVAFNKNLVEGQ